jgi:hypothetical protein
LCSLNGKQHLTQYFSIGNITNIYLAGLYQTTQIMSIDTFLIEEYKSRTQEIQDLMKEARQLELYSAGAVAALYSWFATAELSNNLAWYLPLIIPVLGLIRSWALYERVRQIAEYVLEIESFFLREAENPQGWEHWYARVRKHGLTPSGILFWVLLVAVCLIFPLLYAGGHA